MQGAGWSPAGFRADLLAAVATQTQLLQGHGGGRGVEFGDGTGMGAPHWRSRAAPQQQLQYSLRSSHSSADECTRRRRAVGMTQGVGGGRRRIDVDTADRRRRTYPISSLHAIEHASNEGQTQHGDEHPTGDLAPSGRRVGRVGRVHRVVAVVAGSARQAIRFAGQALPTERGASEPSGSGLGAMGQICASESHHPCIVPAGSSKPRQALCVLGDIVV
jgi:hypothetical protein